MPTKDRPYPPSPKQKIALDTVPLNKSCPLVLSVLSNDCRIALNLDGKTDLSFSTLFSSYFSCASNDASEPIERIVSGNVQKFRKTGEQIIFEKDPSELFVTMNRFGYIQVSKNSIRARKITTSIDAPLRLTLPKNATKSQAQPTLELTSFVVHRGETPSAGHYVCYRKEGNDWSCCNDATVTKITKQELDKARANGYFYHYQRV
jgi:hypothetical protein